MCQSSLKCCEHSSRNFILFRRLQFSSYFKCTPLSIRQKPFQVFSTRTALTVSSLLKMLPSPHVTPGSSSWLYESSRKDLAKAWAPAKGITEKMAIESLLSLQNSCSGFFELVYQSPACNDSLATCDETLFADNVAKNGTTENTDNEDKVMRSYFKQHTPIIRTQIGPCKYPVRLFRG